MPDSSTMTNMKLAERLDNLHEPQTIAMAQRSREIRAKGVDIISLALGEPDFDTPIHIREAAKKAIDEGYSHYPPIAGYMDAREAVCTKLLRDNGLTYKPEQVFISTGAKQCLANLLLALLSPGDEVIIPAPYWVTYGELVKLAEGTPVIVNTRLEDGFKITPEALEEAITPASRCFVFSSPGNPAGCVYSHAELAALVEVFVAHPQISVISDEIYEFISFGDAPQKSVSIASFPEMKDRTAVVNGLSKGYAMTGWRLGYTAAPLEWTKAAVMIQGQLTSATSSITQRAMIAALLGTQEPVAEMAKAFRARRDLMAELLKGIPELPFIVPEGAFYYFPDVSAYLGRQATSGEIIADSEALSMYLLSQAHVATVAGSAFGTEGYLRLSYAASMEQIEEAVKRIAKALSVLV